MARFRDVYRGADGQTVEGGGLCFGERAVSVCADAVGHEEQDVCVKSSFDYVYVVDPGMGR